MKKITFLFALLCASVMGWAAINWDAVDYLGSTDPSISMNTYKYAIDPADTESGPNSIANIQPASGESRLGFYSTYGQGVTSCSHDAKILGDQVWLYVDQLTAQDTKITVTLADASTRAFHLYYKDGTNSPSKPSPELSLNATTKTLEKDATAETFQIIPTKAAGSGNVSYESSDNAVATVSSTGLVTAVGNGTATITVSVEENGDFAADSKTLTVEVIDWPNIGWLQNSGESYKLHISPAIGDNFGGKRIEGTNIWVGCPSAEFGACSIDFTHLGAGASFPLSNFTNTRSQFTLVCQGTTYTFTVYRKFDGVNLAKGKPSYAGRDASNAWQANDNNKGSRWGSEGAQHYAAVGDAAEDWWYVDLGAIYSVETIKILFETACPWDFDILTSPNGTSWVERGTYTEPTHKGNTDADYNEYTISPAQNARYVKIFTRTGYNNLQYGFSMWEFEVYGQPAENIDVNAPVLASAAVSGTPTTTEIQIAVSATDAEDASITLFHVVEPTLGYNRNMTAVGGKLIFSGLVDNTEYNFTITALDNMGNQSNAIIVNASTAVDPLNPSTMAPEPPVRSADDVRAIYSDAYAAILAHDFQIGGQWGAKVGERRVKSGNNYLLYDMSDNTNITWGLNDGGANAIVANDGYHAVGTTGLDASGMEYLHIDIWSQEALTNINVKINDNVFKHINHSGEGWQSYNLALSEAPDSPAPDFTNIRWIKLDGITSDVERHKIAVDNYYFWKAPSGVKAVNVSVNNGLWGSATAKVGDDEVSSVATDTEVTFTATPTSADYDFAYWQIGDTKIETNPYTVAITANTNAEAIFEPHRTTYCRSVVTADNGATIYMTAKKTGAVQDVTGYPQYRLEFEGMAGYAITGPGNFDVWIGHVNGSSGNTQFNNPAWTFDNNTTLYPYGMVYTEFYAEDWREITFPNHYFFFAPGGIVTLNDNFPTASLINWNNSCIDEAAPILAAPTAEALNESTIRLSLSASDDYSNTIWYHITCAAASIDETITGASGVTINKEYTGLTSGTSYEFIITAADGSNPATANISAAQNCSATPIGDAEDPVITSFTATASYGYVDLAITATDDMAGDLTYTITYGTDNVDVVGAAGSETTKRIFALPNTPMLFSVVATDAASHTSAAAVANATTLAVPAAPVPTHEAAAVRSVYSDAYTSAVAASFWRANFGSAAPIAETNDILYRMTANVIVWGNNSPAAGAGNIDGLSGYTYGENTGLDVSGMKYIHFDIFCDADNQLNTVNINDVAVTIPTTRTVAGEWISFDVDITGVALADRQNVRWLKFHPFSTTNCLAVIDNVYFWKEPEYTRNDSWMAPGELGTVCYPEGLKVVGATMYQMAGTDANGKFVFDEVTELEPGVPYLFEAQANELRFYATSATPAIEAGTSHGMVGTFEQQIIPQNSPNIYYFSGQKFYAVTARQTDLTVPANRAYVDLTTPQPAQAPKPGVRRITFDVQGTSTVTGVDNLNASEMPVKVMMDGQLYILRGEKLYDATGRLVK